MIGHHDIEHGDVVDIVITGVVVGFGAPERLVFEKNEVFVASVDTFSTDIVSITVKQHANWPPQTGDTWKDGVGKVWFARSGGGGFITMTPDRPTATRRDMTPEEFLTIGRPALLYRVSREIF